MSIAPDRLSLEALTKLPLSDGGTLTERTIRFYITEKLIPGPQGRGKSAYYTEEHVLRLELIARLSRQGLSLNKIREQIEGLSVDDVRALVADARRRKADLDRATKSPREYIAALLRNAQATPSAEPAAAPAASPAASPTSAGWQQKAASTPPPSEWQHWELAPGVELHVRRDARTRDRALIERLLHAANQADDLSSK